MVVLARESRGWTQKELAAAIGVAQGTISKYELGLDTIPEHHATSICQALRFERELLEQPDMLVGLGGDFLYRKRACVSAKAQRRVEAEANIRRLQVRRLTRSGAIDQHLPFPAISIDEVGGNAERVAIETRNALRIPRGPIRNLTRILENAGAIVFAVDFGTDLIDGTNIRMPGIPPLLFLNANVPGERHRFNLAHELGHVVMHFSTALGDAEDQANAFANEFLMPKAEIRSDLRNLDLAAAMRLKKIWGVSMAAIIHRAHQLRQITATAYKRMFMQLGAAGMRTQEPQPLEFERPEAFEALITLHRQRLGYAEDDVRRLLFTDKLGELPRTVAPQMRLVGLFDDQGDGAAT